MSFSNLVAKLQRFFETAKQSDDLFMDERKMASELPAPSFVVMMGRGIACVAGRRGLVTAVGAVAVELMQLTGCEHALQLTVACLQVAGIVAAVNLEEVADIDLVDPVVLVAGESQHGGHAVGCHTSLGIGLTAVHGVGRDGYRHHCYEGKHHLFHNRQFFSGSTFVSCLQWQR